jgi:hypothetical protein
VTSAVPRHVAVYHASQLVVNERVQIIERLAIAAAPLLEQLRGSRGNNSAMMIPKA